MSKKQSFTNKETTELVRLLGKLRWPMPYSIFVALLKSVPIVAVDLAVMPDKNHVLLTYRDDDFYKGWHIPGSILRYGDTVQSAWRRVANHELGMHISRVDFLTYFNYKDNREEGITLFFVAKPSRKPKDGTYFALNKIPKEFVQTQLPEIVLLKKRARRSATFAKGKRYSK